MPLFSHTLLPFFPYSREYWTATVDASACYSADDISCVMFLAFCHPVPPEIGETCYNSAICQKGYDQDGNVVELSMGAFSNYTHFYESKNKSLHPLTLPPLTNPFSLLPITPTEQPLIQSNPSFTLPHPLSHSSHSHPPSFTHLPPNPFCLPQMMNRERMQAFA